MNFLKVKKLMYVFCLSFFISCGFVSAKTLEGSIHAYNTDRNEKLAGSINLFQETKLSTGFIQFLYGQGYNLGNYLNNYFGINDSSFFDGNYNYAISIFTIYDLSNVSILTGTYSGAVYLDSYSSDDCYYSIVFSDNSKSYFSIFEDSYQLVLNYKYIFYFNSQGVPIGYFLYTNSFPKIDKNISFYDSSYDLTSLYAHTFKLDLRSSFYDKIFPGKFYLYGDYSSNAVKDASGYNLIINWYSSLFGNSEDLSGYNLNFVYDDVFYNVGDEFIPLFNRWFDESSFSVPDGYSSFDVSGTSKGYYLLPIAGCSYDDYKFYYSGSSTLNNYYLAFNYYYYSVENNSLDFHSKYAIFSSSLYTVYFYDPLGDLAVSVDEFLDYFINVYQYSTKYSYILYYNSSCYKKYYTTDSYILDFSSGSYDITVDEFSKNYSNNVSNSSNYTGGFINSSNSSSNSNVSGSIIGSTDSLDFSSIVANIPKYVSSFYSSISAIVGVSTIFLAGLPIEIYTILLAIFTLGLIILIIKIFH